ncbi:MAG: cyclic nucleotide-binding domain-containing protein [Candidatus Lindowbacteria bacterium]|nr:cyclic nucleotide-binding domain-containing protein [Candidatus Lindowbacteria bacterium]
MLFFKKKEDVSRIYQGLSSHEMKQLNKAGIQEWFAKGAPIFRKGQTGKEMFIIVDGCVRILDDTVSPPRQIAVLREGELFGELSLSTKETKRSNRAPSLQRSASAIAETDTTMFVVEETAFGDLLEKHHGLASRLLMNLFYITSERLRESIRNKLIDEGVPLPKMLKGFKDEDKRRLLKFSDVKRYPQGQSVFLEGQVGTELYCVLVGTVEITKRQGAGMKRLAVMGEGDIFGELGLVTKKGRTASAVALSDADLLAISEDGLQKLCKKSPDIATKLFLNLFRITTARMRSLIGPAII